MLSRFVLVSMLHCQHPVIVDNLSDVVNLYDMILLQMLDKHAPEKCYVKQYIRLNVGRDKKQELMSIGKEQEHRVTDIFIPNKNANTKY